MACSACAARAAANRAQRASGVIAPKVGVSSKAGCATCGKSAAELNKSGPFSGKK